MSVQKYIQYKRVNLLGKELESLTFIRLNVIINFGNYLIHKNILKQYALRQKYNSSTKRRSEIRGGGRKPWRQKGTGQARAGSNRSPLWKGGGVIFGPKPKKITYKINKKERNLALQTLLYNKKNDILIIDDLETTLIKPKTKHFCTICSMCGINLKTKILVIVSKKSNTLKYATRNFKNVELISSSNLHLLSLISAKHIILTPLALIDLKEFFYE